VKLANKVRAFCQSGISVLTLGWAHLSRISDFNFIDSRDHMLAVLWCQSQIALTTVGGERGPNMRLIGFCFSLPTSLAAEICPY
jgi:hypothetical protein